MKQYGNPNVTKNTKFELKCAKCKFKGAKVQNLANSRVQKVITANTRVQKYRSHAMDLTKDLQLYSTSPYQNSEISCPGI